RLRPCAGEFEPLTEFNDRALVQAICALRLFLPDVGIVLSTREPASLRDRLIPLGITMMSAGSHTEPGGYTGAGQDNLHYTERGRIVELAGNASEWAATSQFDIADEREPSAVAATLTRLGYEPVWKDWDASILAN
ncbi:MAG TPA: 2-iminoacetate synthase ThiH, partial [Verrucomicrobia bacterium]|nr:2-iminoacetate synthase ThiH [Verrucomicrobiota bacterium]